MIAEDPVITALAGFIGCRPKLEKIRDALMAVGGVDKMTVEFVSDGVGGGDFQVSYPLPTGKTRVISVSGQSANLTPEGELN